MKGLAGMMGLAFALLAQRPDYDPQLRMKILQAADGLFRAAAIRERDSAVARLR